MILVENLDRDGVASSLVQKVLTGVRQVVEQTEVSEETLSLDGIVCVAEHMMSQKSSNHQVYI